jgi:hypothetical protein
MSTPPKFPWVKGVQPDYRSFIVRVGVAQTNDNNVWSYSDLEDDRDVETCGSLPSRGVEQIAFGLLCEAIRREAYLQVLLRLTSDKDYVSKFDAASPDEKQKMLGALADSTSGSIKASVDRMATDACHEVLHMLLLAPSHP